MLLASGLSGDLNPVDLNLNNLSFFFMEIEGSFYREFRNVGMCNDCRLNELLYKSKASAVVN